MSRRHSRGWLLMQQPCSSSRRASRTQAQRSSRPRCINTYAGAGYPAHATIPHACLHPSPACARPSPASSAGWCRLSHAVHGVRSLPLWRNVPGSHGRAPSHTVCLRRVGADPRRALLCITAGAGPTGHCRCGVGTCCCSWMLLGLTLNNNNNSSHSFPTTPINTHARTHARQQSFCRSDRSVHQRRRPWRRSSQSSSHPLPRALRL